MSSDLLIEASGFRTLAEAFAWAHAKSPRGELNAVVTQDEFTHDIVLRVADAFLVFDTT